jgi:methyl-accepting chemotaxis protein
MSDSNSITIEIKALASDFTSIFQGVVSDIQKLNSVVASCNAALNNLAAGFLKLNQNLAVVSNSLRNIRPVNPQVPASIQTANQETATLKSTFMELGDFLAAGQAWGSLIKWMEGSIAGLLKLNDKFKDLKTTIQTFNTPISQFFKAGTAEATAFDVALTGVFAVLSIIASFFAGWELGTYIGKLKAGGQSINEWAEMIEFEISASLERLLAYVAYFWDQSKKYFKEGFDEVEKLTLEGVLKIAEAWNKMPFTHKIDLSNLKSHLSDAEADLKKLQNTDNKAILDATLHQIDGTLQQEIGRIQGIDLNSKVTPNKPNAQPIAPAQVPIPAAPSQDALAVQTNLNVKTDENLATQKNINTTLDDQKDKTKDIAEAQKSFSDQLKDAWEKFQQEVGNTAGDMAKVVMSPFQGIRSGLDSAFETLLEKGTTVKKFFGTVSLAIAKSFCDSVAQMAADWITKGVMMVAQSAATQMGITTATGAGAATRAGIRTGETAHDAAMTGVQVATHTAGETAKTGSTVMGALGRGMVRLAETVWHGILVAIQVAAHVAGEIAKTAATVAQGLIRGMVNVILAGIGALEAMAGIPYVGPILAVAAMAAMIALGTGALKGFAEGGRPLIGQLAMVGERGPELFVPDTAGTIIPAHQTAALMRGSGGRTGGASVPASRDTQTNVHNAVYFDKQKLVDELAKSDAHEKFIVDVMAKNIHKFQ